MTTLPIAANSAVAISARSGAYDFSATGKIWTLPEAGRGTVLFTATGTNDVHVALCTQNTVGGDLYEIVIGGWSNGRSVIRRGAQGPELAVALSGLTTPGKANPLWISIDSTTGWIKVGRGKPGQDMFLSYQDSAFLSATRYVTFSAWNTPIDYSQVSTLALNATPTAQSLGFGLWRFSEVSYVPASNGLYDQNRPRWRLNQGRGVFSFTIDNNDAYIKLSPADGSASATYEIILGGWNNTKSALRKNGTEIASGPVGLLSPGGRNAFWISIDDRTGIIQIGRNAPGQDVLLFTVDATLRSATPVTSRFVNISAYGQAIFFSNIVAAPLTANVSPAIPTAPNVDHMVWMANLPIPGSTRWVKNCGVRYAVAFELPDGSELRSPWWTNGGTDPNGYFTSPNYGLPLLINIAVDPSRRILGRRIYRQFLGDATETLLTRMPNLDDTSFRDADAAMPIKSTRVSLGDNYVTGVKRTGVALPAGFAQAPGVVLATPLGEDYPDTFAVSSSVIGAQSATFNTYRMDALSRWGQNLGAGVLCCEELKRPNLQSGSTAFGASSTSLMQRTINFSQAFAKAPRVIATVRGENVADTFAVTVSSVSTTSCNINIVRLDSAAGWSQNVRVDWIAFRDEALTDLQASAAACGTAVIGTGLATVKRVPVSFGRTFAAPPIVHLGTQSEPYPDAFSVTATNITTTGFVANVKRADAPANGWGLNLQLNWLALL